MDYIHDRKNWPKLTWRQERLAGQLAGVRHRQGRLIGRMEGLGFSLRNEAVLQTLTEDVLKSSRKSKVKSWIRTRCDLLSHADWDLIWADLYPLTGMSRALLK